MSGLMWRLWFISCSLGILFCCSISLLKAPSTVVVAGLQPSFPDVVQYYARRFLQESSPPPSSFISPTLAPSVFAPPPPPPPPPPPAPSASPPAPTPVNPPSLSLPVSPTPFASPSPSSIPPPSSSPAPSTTSPVSAPAGNPPQFSPSLPVSLPSLSSPSSSFTSPTPSSSSPPPPISSAPPSPPPLSPSPLSTTPSSTPLSPPPTSLPPSPSPASSSPSSPPLSLSPPSPSPSLSPPSPPPSSTPPSSPPIAPPPSFLFPPSASPPTSLPPTPTVPSTTPPPVAYPPTSPPQNSPPPATPPPTSPTNSPTSPSSPPSTPPPPPPPPPSNNVVPSPSSVPTPPPSSSPSPSVVSPSSPPFSSFSSPPPPPPNNPPPVPPPSPTPAPVSSPPTSPAPLSTPPALAPSSLVSPSSPVILSPPPQSSPLTSPSPSAGCCSANTILRPGSSNASSSCDCVNAITVELQFDNALSNATTLLFQQELAQQLNFTNAQVQVSFNRSTGSRLGLQFASQSPLIVTAAMGPLTGSSFPQNLSLKIRTAIVSHEVVFSSDFGNYTLLSLYPPLGNVLTPAPSTVNTASTSTSKKSKTGLIIGVAAGGGVILIILAVIVWICCCSKRRADPESATRGPINPRVTAVLDPEVVTPNEQIILADSKSFPRPENTQQFSYEELREATNDFAPECFLGEGGFGKVYRGELRDGTEVAIKKLTIGGHQGDREFLVEVEMLSRLHHRHLVKLLGYFCSHEPRQQLLCYELIPNGSLEAWLHGSLGVTRGPLDWPTRMKIAIGAARGLAYLHEDSQPCVIHRDFKASNILLQNNFNPKVADFGLARLAPEGQGNYVSTRVMGTFGYVAPEYAMTGHLLVKSDVYSYGVVLLELLSGRKPVDLTRSEGGENITTWASPMLNNRERVFELADVRLEGKYPREDFVKVAALAAACIAREWRMRPTMGEVVQTLTAVCRSLEYDLSSDGDRGVNSAGEREGGGASTPTSSTSGGSHLGFSTQWHPPPHASTNLGSEDGSSSLFSSGPFMGTPPEPLSDHLSRTHIIPEDLHEGR